MKRIICTILAIFILSCTVGAAAATPAPGVETQKEDIFSYTVSHGQATICDIDDTRENVVIPESLGGHTVVALGNGALGGSSKTKTVVIPDTVSEIASMCFAYSESIQSITLPAGLKNINDNAFYCCKNLWTVTIPYGCLSIGTEAFGLCSGLTAITVPSTVVYIGPDAFPQNARIYAKPDSNAALYASQNGLSFEEYITVTVNDKELVFDQPCIMDTEYYSAMVPMRAVLEAMGGTVTWNDTFRIANIDIDGNRLNIRVGEPFMMLNGRVVYLTCPAIEYNERLLLPIRSVVESIGGKVVWKEDEKRITITY